MIEKKNLFDLLNIDEKKLNLSTLYLSIPNQQR